MVRLVALSSTTSTRRPSSVTSLMGAATLAHGDVCSRTVNAVPDRVEEAAEAQAKR
jgi:hypothetical protein